MRTPRPGEWIAENTEVRVPAAAVRAAAARAAPEHTRSYRICGHRFRLACDEAEPAERFAHAFRHLATDEAAEDATELVYLTRHSGPEGFPALLDPAAGRARVFAYESVSPTQLFMCMLLDRFLPVTDHLVLHASVLEHDGGVTTFLGRTHAGKTTLALALALHPDVRFYSDEYCPIRIADGFVPPVPRVLGVRAWTRAMLEERGVRFAAPPDDAGQIDVDPADIAGFELGTGGPLRNVVLVAGEAGDAPLDDVRDLDVEFVTDELLADLGRVVGVQSVVRRPEHVGSGRTVRVHVEPGARLTDALMNVCERHGMRLHGLLPAGARRPDFTQPPELHPLGTLPGLMELVRHTVNREILGDNLAGLMDRAATAVGGARFFQLKPGPLDATVKLVLDEVM